MRLKRATPRVTTAHSFPYATAAGGEAVCALMPVIYLDALLSVTARHEQVDFIRWSIKIEREAHLTQKRRQRRTV